MKEQSIKCDIHDYVEIACLYKIEVKLTLLDGSQQIVTPIDTAIDKERAEVLQVRERPQSAYKYIRLTDITKMSATSVNPHFSEVYFK